MVKLRFLPTACILGILGAPAIAIAQPLTASDYRQAVAPVEHAACDTNPFVVILAIIGALTVLSRLFRTHGSVDSSASSDQSRERNPPAGAL